MLLPTVERAKIPRRINFMKKISARNAAAKQSSPAQRSRRVLVIDIGGTHVKILVSGHTSHRQFDSGPKLTPKQLVAQVRKLTTDWPFDVVAIGYPGPVRNDRPTEEPWNLGRGWVRFNFSTAFRCPVKMINDAAMQALGSYRDGKMLFLGLGTGLGSAMVADGVLIPMELAHLTYRDATFEDYLGIRGLKKFGEHKWRQHVNNVVKLLTAALLPDDVVLGGGNVHRFKQLPPGCRAGDNANAFLGGLRLWGEPDATKRISSH